MKTLKIFAHCIHPKTIVMRLKNNLQAILIIKKNQLQYEKILKKKNYLII